MKTKVLFCVPSPSNKGGITNWAGIILQYFKNHEDKDVELIHLALDRSVSLTHLMPKYKRIWYAIKDYYKFPIKLYKCLHKGTYRVAHITSVGSWMGSLRDFIFCLICKLLDVKSIVHYHCGTIPQFCKQNNIGWKFQLFVIKHVSCVIVLDEKSLTTLLSLGCSNVRKVPNPISEELLHNISEKKREKRTLLFVGHVIPSKGILELLDAVNGIDDIKINVFGPQNPKIDDVIKEKIRSHPLCNSITFHGLQPPEIIYENMRRSSLFVLPTHGEGFPLVILEAMACGCPIISTPVGAIKEMLTTENEIAGYLVPPKNVEELHKAIVYCLTHVEESMEKASLAKQKVLSTYTLDLIVRQLKEIWCSF